ncbi:MAG: DUF547 domain-containing protein [Candidatus Binatia bacterium]|nr:MAG: DUF547 domain-containing protein [Candidatus Binatia bacterium]
MPKLRPGFLCLLLAAFSPLAAAPPRAPSLHAPWSRLLARYVDEEGLVAYRSLEREARPELDAYLDRLARTDPETFDRKEQIAFWIDAYNANVVRGVLSGQTAESFLARKRFFSWWRFPVAGKERTLDEIEHEILRKRFSEPRVHFALVCASRSCPKLRREAYEGARLDEQLDDQVRSFLLDPERNVLEPGRLRLSSIFRWFAEDFEKSGGLLPFLRRYVDIPGEPAIEYLPYDWSLNAQPGERP